LEFYEVEEDNDDGEVYDADENLQQIEEEEQEY
jgi:hypothetical protein